MTPISDPLLRLRALDPAPAPPAVSGGELGDRLTAELGRILATPVTRAPGRGWWWRRLHSHTGRLAAALVALVVVGTGVAYAVGLPHDVIAVFAGEPQATGAPVPWGAHDVHLAATLPLDRGRVLQVWEAANDLNGTCEYDRLLSATGIARNLGGGCEGGFRNGATPGVTPAPASVLLHLSMEVQPLYPDRVSDGPTFYYGQVFEPGITGVDLHVPGHPVIPFTLVSGGTWGVVKLPRDPGSGSSFDSAGITVVLRDRQGAVQSTIDMTSDNATPCDFYRADGTIGSSGGCADGS